MQRSRAENFTSNYEWSKSVSRYHFDDAVVDKPGEWFQEIGNIRGEWNDEVKQIIVDTPERTWATRKSENEKNRFLAMELNDIAQGGGDPEAVISKLGYNVEDYPKINRIADFFELESVQKRLHVQLTGQLWHLHIDKLYHIDKIHPENVVRISIMLTDWTQGHIYQYGTTYYSHWKAGDVHVFDWMNTPHSTANTSYKPRVTLQLTGLKTAKTNEILNNAPYNFPDIV